MSLPNFLMIGAQRAGTSLLHQILMSHSDIYLPRHRKEIHYFDRYYTRGALWYESYFPSECDALSYSAIGEATPDYLCHPDALSRIYTTLPICRFLVILRNPVERAYSWYNYCRRNYNIKSTFRRFIAEDLTAIEWGMYGRHLGRYLERYEIELFFVIIYEEFVSNPGYYLEKLGQFLGLRHNFLIHDGLLDREVNSSAVTRRRWAFAAARRVGSFLLQHDVNWPVHVAKQAGVGSWFGRGPAPPPMDEEMRTYLMAIYADDIGRLRTLLGCDLGVWGLDV